MNNYRETAIVYKVVDPHGKKYRSLFVRVPGLEKTYEIGKETVANQELLDYGYGLMAYATLTDAKATAYPIGNVILKCEAKGVWTPKRRNALGATFLGSEGRIKKILDGVKRLNIIISKLKPRTKPAYISLPAPGNQQLRRGAVMCESLTPIERVF